MEERLQPGPEDLLAHAEWLGRVARALVGPGAAADLVQDTFEVALTRPPVRPGPLRPWLAGVARNLARMTARGRGRQQRRELAVAGEAPADVPGPDALVARVELQQMLARHVLALTEPLRATVLLRFVEGLSSVDIARVQGVPEGTVRWRLKAALDQLRERLDAEQGGRDRWPAVLAPLIPLAPAVAPTPTAATTTATATASPAAGASTVTTTSPATLAGGLAMKLAIKLLVVVVATALLAVTTHQLGWWPGGRSDRPAPAVAAPVPGAGRPIPASPTDEPAPSAPRVAGASRDDDPRGELRLEGQVIGAGDAPVAGALVAIDTVPVRTATTEDDGSFVFEHLLARDYHVEATSGDGYAGPAQLRMTAEAQPLILRLRPAGLIEVEVQDEAGAAVAGAQVELRSTLVWSSTTDATGLARLRGVGPVFAPLAVRADGFAPAGRMVSFRGSPGLTERVAIVLARGVAVAGQVVDEAGAPVPGAVVVASAAAEPFPLVDVRRDGVRADEEGRFRLRASPGTWRLHARHPGHAPGTSAPFRVEPGQDKDGLVLTLAGGASLGGVVRDRQGQPVAGADVRVVVTGQTEWRAQRQGVTSGDGRFSLVDLPRRAVDVVAWHPSGASAITSVDLAATPKAELTLTLDVAGAIRGVVVDGAGQPIGDALVLAEPRGPLSPADRTAWSVRGVQEVVTDPGGGFAFAGLPDAEYTVRAVRPGAAQGSWLSEGTRTRPGGPDLRLVLPADGRVVGKVALPDGSPATAFVAAVGGAWGVPFTSTAGEFALEAAPGRHAVVITGPGFVAHHHEAVEIKPGADTDLGTITVTPGRSVSGRVTRTDGTPASGATVAAGHGLSGGGAELFIADESPGARETTTDRDGRYLLEGFGPGALMVVAGGRDLGRSQSARVPAGATSAVVDLVLAPTTGLRGRVVKAGAPLADTIVIANPLMANSSNFFVSTGPDGTFAFDALAPDTYVIYPMIGGGGPRPKDMYVYRVEVEAGKTADLELDATPGNSQLELSVVTADGKPAGTAFSLIVQGVVTGTTLDDLRDGGRLPDMGSKPVAIHLRVVVDGKTRIDGARPGHYTACVAPLPPPGGDPGAGKMNCGGVDVAAGAPAKVTVALPAPAAPAP
ncbi:MAG: sigma-70 family RNA polymerase sigma factor [Kofleriaceae bacterium]|nr:sigma-70 family RNA polymerase sigma factor [Kofleriaceae bacterium]